MEVGGVKTSSAAGGVGVEEEINWGLPDWTGDDNHYGRAGEGSRDTASPLLQFLTWPAQRQLVQLN